MRRPESAGTRHGPVTVSKYPLPLSPPAVQAESRDLYFYQLYQKHCPVQKFCRIARCKAVQYLYSVQNLLGDSLLLPPYQLRWSHSVRILVTNCSVTSVSLIDAVRFSIKYFDRLFFSFPRKSPPCVSWTPAPTRQATIHPDLDADLVPETVSNERLVLG